MPAAIRRLEKQGMLSRALSLATVTLLIGCLTAGVARAENLDAGKSPSQIFSNTCNACHKSPRGLLKSVSASSLPGFLRQHYTTGTDMASVLSSYLISNGAADPRYQSKDQPKKEAKQDGRPDKPDRFGRRLPSAAPAQEASRPDADGAPSQGEGAHPGRDAKRLARPHAAPDAAKPADGQAPVQAATDSKSGVRQKGRRGKPAAVEEPPKTEQAAPGDAANEDASRDAAKAETAATDSARTDPAKTDAIKTDTIKGEGDKPAGDAKPVDESENPAREGRSETAKVDAPKENVGSEPNPLRPDLVPPVTPAPPASAATGPDSSASPPAATPPPVTATAPAAPPSVPAGPPAPPISR
jgi:hypothetical protein